MKNPIYEKHEKAFAGISSYAICRVTEDKAVSKIASLSFKTSKSGVVTCYFHVYGSVMISGKAGGGGYDKLSASFYDAADKHLKTELERFKGIEHKGFHELEVAYAFLRAARKGSGSDRFVTAIKSFGYEVIEF